MTIYRAKYVAADHLEPEYDDGVLVDLPEPEGWREYSIDMWGEHRAFFAPSDRPIYRSRSSAQRRVNLINRWFGDGTAILVESEEQWRPVSEANALRRAARRQKRIDRLRAEIAALEEVSS